MVEELIKVFTVGNTDVGKTSIIKQFIKKEFKDQVTNTQGLDFFITNMNINNKEIKFHVWDTAGQERYKGITTAYFKNAHGILLVFAINSRKTFEQLDQWLQSIKDSGRENIKLLLIGNKCDLENEREVTIEEAQKFAHKNNMKYLETSAKTDTNIDNAFKKIGELIVKDLSSDSPKEGNKNSISLQSQIKDIGDKKECPC